MTVCQHWILFALKYLKRNMHEGKYTHTHTHTHGRSAFSYRRDTNNLMGPNLEYAWFVRIRVPIKNYKIHTSTNKCTAFSTLLTPAFPNTEQTKNIIFRNINARLCKWLVFLRETRAKRADLDFYPATIRGK